MLKNTAFPPPVIIQGGMQKCSECFSALLNDVGQPIVTMCFNKARSQGNENTDHTREAFWPRTSQVSFSEDTQEGQ